MEISTDARGVGTENDRETVMGIDYSALAFPKSRPRVLDRQDKAKADEREERRVKALVRARDGGQCRIMGCRAKPVEVHHIVKRSQSRALKFDPLNLVCLCDGPGTPDHHGLGDAGVLKFGGNPEGNGFHITDTRTGRKVQARTIR